MVFSLLNWLIIVVAVLLMWTGGNQCSAVIAQSNIEQTIKCSDDEKIIRAQAQEYLKDFAAADAEAIAVMWTPDGTFIDVDGNEFHGRSEIEKLYAHYFVQHGRSALQGLEMSINSIRFPARNVAIEEGTTRLSKAPSTTAGSKYVVVHIKQNGKWLISNSTETSIKPIPNVESLKDLSWLVGTWTPAFAKGKVLLNMSWLGNNNFINCTFSIHGLPIEEISDIQIIGWDPIRQAPTSWNFASGGGFGRALWTKDGDTWLLRAHSIQPDGTTGQATYILHKLDNDTFTWKSVERSVDGSPIADTLEVRLLRESSK